MNGLIALLGSGEYLPVMDDVDRYLLAHCGANGRKPRVVCLPTGAGREGEESINRWSKMGIEHFTRLNADVLPVPIIDRDSANDPQWEPTLENADLIYFSGGNPLYLYETLQGSRAWAAAQKAWASGAAYAGCSAGAMILGRQMPNFHMVGLNSVNGFGLLPATYIIPHFDAIPSIWKPIIQGVRRRLEKDEIMIGIDEDTALVGQLGKTWTVMGKSMVHVFSKVESVSCSAGEEVKI